MITYHAEVEFIETKGIKAEADSLVEARELINELISTGRYHEYLTRELTEVDFTEEIILIREEEWADILKLFVLLKWTIKLKI